MKSARINFGIPESEYVLEVDDSGVATSLVNQYTGTEYVGGSGGSTVVKSARINFGIPESEYVLGVDESGVATSLVNQYTGTEYIGSSVEIVPFSTGTDEQVLAMIQAAHAGTLDLQTDGGWAVGDVRTITVNAFTAGGTVSVAQQQVDIVISSFDEYMSCGNVMQFDFKDALAENVRMNSSANNSGGFGSSEMYDITLPALVEALPLWLKTLLITFNVLGSAGNTSDVIETVLNNKLALRSEIEIFGNISYSKAGEGSQIPYYTTSANRIKKIGHTGNAGRWWERSPEGNSTGSFCDVYTDGLASKNFAQRLEGVAPFGCL